MIIKSWKFFHIYIFLGLLAIFGVVAAPEPIPEATDTRQGKNPGWGANQSHPNLMCFKMSRHDIRIRQFPVTGSVRTWQVGLIVSVWSLLFFFFFLCRLLIQLNLDFMSLRLIVVFFLLFINSYSMFTGCVTSAAWHSSVTVCTNVAFCKEPGRFLTEVLPPFFFVIDASGDLSVPVVYLAVSHMLLYSITVWCLRSCMKLIRKRFCWIFLNMKFKCSFCVPYGCSPGGYCFGFLDFTLPSGPLRHLDLAYSPSLPLSWYLTAHWSSNWRPV